MAAGCSGESEAPASATSPPVAPAAPTPAPPVPAETPLPEVRDLERLPLPQVERRLARLPHEHKTGCRVVVRLRGEGVETARNADWWRVKIAPHFGAVDAPAAEGGIAVFDCGPGRRPVDDGSA